ncbi:dipeptide/oligopeptide/nickel ABC transporter permease/ATP-binding protein [Actinokineospora sp. NBRC 105648]|uniref:dipeptide/oligopeptide/nickel ABC transporter permease/ATP-binding protein n=1 Tax=Actinokineospora sp. NBRC 105648 TaxID=3032206 RepID=UPI0024A59B5E|nr:dipeptide/oligopeptide/nickel ABC transporter permease/ATP-binding protein [Actinokineospora sp. NBRC 105648]GLZ42545.1 dipeptide/oligopeptide/nickel ABC transporter ATP-binding protein [Actinokineospora sp. NBRC 105648]
MTAVPFPAALAPVKRISLGRRYLRRPLGVVALALLLVVVAAAVLAPWLAPFDPNHVDFTLTHAEPGGGHLLGGDSAGRDILSRLLHGARTTLYGAVITCVSGLLLGVPAGVCAGYFGGVTDRLASWVSDALQSVPGMIVLLVVAAGTGQSFPVLMVALGVFLAPGYYRITRARALAVRKEPYIDAARVAGVTNPRILRTHMLRAVYAPIVVQTALTAGIAIGMQAGLQFLGIGSASTPSWGQMMNDGFQNMLTYPLILLWPSIALGITIAALAFIGSTLADLISIRAEQPSRRARARVRQELTAPAATELSNRLPSGEHEHSAEDCALRIDNLRVGYASPSGVKEVVRGVSLDAAPGEVLGIVGESGSGKTQTMFAVLDLLPSGGTAVADGIRVSGREVSGLSAAERAALLGRSIGYVPQEPLSNLDPCYTIERQLVEPLRHVHGLSKADARQRARDVLVRVGLTDPDRVLASYPHQISGGMAQRVLIAGAVAGRPSLLVADEPTTALDVTVQAEVLELLRELQQEYGMTLVIVTHNFGVVADICDRVVVMKDGRIVETGRVEQIFRHPADPYTAELISASLDDVAGRHELDQAWARESPAALDRSAAHVGGEDDAR